MSFDIAGTWDYNVTPDRVEDVEPGEQYFLLVRIGDKFYKELGTYLDENAIKALEYDEELEQEFLPYCWFRCLDHDPLYEPIENVYAFIHMEMPQLR